MANKKECGISGRYKDVTTVSGLSGKSITGVECYTTGSTECVEISYSGGSTLIKMRQGLVEIAGTNEWNSGTQV